MLYHVLTIGLKRREFNKIKKYAFGGIRTRYPCIWRLL